MRKVLTSMSHYIKVKNLFDEMLHMAEHVAWLRNFGYTLSNAKKLEVTEMNFMERMLTLQWTTRCTIVA